MMKKTETGDVAKSPNPVKIIRHLSGAVVVVLMLCLVFAAPAAAVTPNVYITEYTYNENDAQVTSVPELVGATYSSYYKEKLMFLLGTSSSANSDYAVFGGAAWPIPNAYNKYGSCIFKSSVNESNYPTGKVTIHTSMGCMAYASYCTVVFEDVTISKTQTYGKNYSEDVTVDEMKSFVQSNVQVGEHIRFIGKRVSSDGKTHSKSHSIIYLVEDADGNGFYFLDSNGVSGQNAKFKYTTYDRLTSYANNYDASVFVYESYSGNGASDSPSSGDTEVMTPGMFEILSPVCEQVFTSVSPVSVTWSASEGAVGYRFALRDLTDNVKYLDNVWIDDTTTYTIDSQYLTAGHEYRFAVAACDADNESVWVESLFSIFGEDSSSDTAIIISPAEDSVLQYGSDVTVSWSPVSYADFYEITLLNAESGDLVSSDLVYATTSHTFAASQFSEQTRYCVGVIAYDEEGGKHGYVRYFTIGEDNVPEPETGTPDTSWYDAGDTEYFIDNANELAGLAELVNSGTDSFDGKTIYLTGDIDLNGINWMPIGSVMYDTVFSGKFDGNDHVIYNLTISDYRTPAGLFGYVGDAEIYHVNLVNVSISAESYVGGIVGYMHFSDVSDCHVSGSISGGWDVGGIVGHAEYTNNIDACTVKNSYINAINASMGDVGGIAGYVYDRTHVSNCTVGDTAIYGTVGVDVGGIAGSVGCDSSVKNCIVEFCNLNGDDYSCVGGIAGALGGSSYLDTSSVSSVNVTHGSSVGGLVGDIYEGYVAYSAVHDTDVCDGTYVGGLVGQISNGGVNYCLVTGSVSGNHYTGGIAGFSSSSGIHYSIALVEFADGVITSRLGYPSSGSEYSYDYAWVSMTSYGELFTTDISISAHNGESVSSTIFWNNQSFFEENLFFDFGEMWTMNSGNENYQLPVLQFQCTPVTGDATYLLESEPATPSLTLVNGWNFVSVPKALDAGCNTAVKLFGSIDTAGNAILGYNASSQSWEQVTADTVIKPLFGYWIYSDSSSSVPLIYSDVPTVPAMKQLYPGWNAVGLSAEVDTAASSFFAGLKWRVALPWNCEKGVYDSAIVNGGSAVNSPDRLLSLGNGCWLYVEEANVLPGLTA